MATARTLLRDEKTRIKDIRQLVPDASESIATGQAYNARIRPVSATLGMSPSEATQGCVSVCQIGDCRDYADVQVCLPLYIHKYCITTAGSAEIFEV